MAKKVKKTLKNPRPESEKDKIKRTKVRVIGIGGGAGNIVSEIAFRIKKASFAAANTDLQALRALRRSVCRFQFGENLTHGLGTGMNHELAKEASLSEKERIKNLFKGQDFCILVASLGGGVGSGAGPVFAKLAKSSGAITLGVFTLPFKFEGEKKQEIARESLQKLRPYLNAIAVLPNDRIFQLIDKSTPIKEALSAINKNLAESLEGLIETIYLPGLINIDFADFKTILQGQGRFAYLNTVEVQGANRALEAIKKALNCPLYPYTIRGAKKVLFNITGERELSLSDVSQISKTIFELVNPEAKIIFGISQDKKYRDRIKIALLAIGCGVKIFSEKAKKPKRISKKRTRKKVLPRPEKKKTKQRKKSKPKPKKVKVQIKVKKKEVPPPKIEEKPEEEVEVRPAYLTRAERRVESKKVSSCPSSLSLRENSMKNERSLTLEKEPGIKVRKNALQIKKETEDAEKEFLAKEQIWEPPAFLRKQQNK